MSSRMSSDAMVTSSLIGRRVRGYYTARDPNYIAYGEKGYNKHSPTSVCWIEVIAEGEVVAVSVHDNELRLWTLDDECLIRKVRAENAVVLPRDHVGALR